MMAFRSEEHIDRWCREKDVPRGASLNLEMGWKLAQAVFPGRLELDWQPKSAADMEAVFQCLGLTGEFWHGCLVP